MIVGIQFLEVNILVIPRKLGYNIKKIKNWKINISKPNVQRVCSKKSNRRKIQWPSSA